MKANTLKKIQNALSTRVSEKQRYDSQPQKNSRILHENNQKPSGYLSIRTDKGHHF
jgi:hypothetical protein